MSTGETRPERNPETPVDKLRDMVTSFVDTIAAQGEKAFDAFGLRVGRHWAPPVDVIEKPDAVQVFVDMPGIDFQRVDVVLVGNMLTIKGERPTAVLESCDVPHRRERVTGAFSRSIPMPTDVNPDNVTAEAKNGVLTITLAREKSAAPRQIRVQIRQAADASVVCATPSGTVSPP